MPGRPTEFFQCFAWTELKSKASLPGAPHRLRDVTVRSHLCSANS